MDWNDVTSVLWFLGIGAFFYWMMKKGGCGMHGGHSHGSHGSGGHQHGDGGPKTGLERTENDSHGGSVRDPVCGMQVDRDRAAGMRKAMEHTYYLCSDACLEEFDRDPDGYARRGDNSTPTRPVEHAGRHLHSSR